MGNQLNCLEHCRTHQEQQHRLLVLQQGTNPKSLEVARLVVLTFGIGDVFKRKKFVLGIQSGSEKIHLRLSGDEQFFLWKPHEGNKSATKIDVAIVGTIKVQGSTGFTIVSRKSEALLDLEADNEEQRNVWVTNLQLLCDDGEDTGETIEVAASGSKFRRMIEERNKKQTYWAQRTQELEDRKKDAEERKKQFTGAGMKYTALAMSNRVPSAKADD